MRDLVDQILSSDGPIARSLRADASAKSDARASGYESRPQQVAMARAVWDCFDAHAGAAGSLPRRTLMVEAGTGVGKSFAYLIPAILRIVLRGEKAVISTHTISLQEQLMEKDVPLLVAALEPWLKEKFPDRKLHALRPVLVKGRSNYLSIRRLQLASERADALLTDMEARAQLERIEKWALDTRDGTLATLPQLTRPEVWTHVQSDTDNCMGRKCPHHEACFYQEARRRAETGNLLVCNHALFFADLALRSLGAGLASEIGEDQTGNGPTSGGQFGILPPHHHVVLDEAHTVEDVASEHLGLSLTEGRINHLLRTLYEPRRRKGFLGQLASSPLANREPEAIQRAINLTLQAGDASRLFFEHWERLVESGRAPQGRVMGPRQVENSLSPAMADLALRLKGLRELVRTEADKFELNAYARRAEGIALAAKHYIEQEIPDSVYWVELGPPRHASRHGRRRIELACAPIEVGPILRDRLFDGSRSIILTSATLATRAATPDEHPERAETAFAHAMTRLGCEPERTLAMQLGSPFDFAKQATLYIEGGVDSPTPTRASPRAGGKGSPSISTFDEFSQVPREESASAWPTTNAESQMPNAASYESSLADAILRHVDETDGGAFVLFTSFKVLDAVARLLESPLGDRSMPLLTQIEGGAGGRGHMLRAFRENRRSVLFGAASFWQGVDVRGDALRCVIITKLPFDPPDRPLTQARLERIKARGGNPFMEESLPRAVIRFKQGFGRLIRSQTDTGRVVVLDSRIVTARYGRIFLEALPKGVKVVRGNTVERGGVTE